MKLETATLKDVLSHEDSSVSFGKTLTVLTGSSDSGKSAVLRGLDQTLRNRPAGIDLLRHGAKRGACSEFAIAADDDGKKLTLVRRRGKSRNEYELDGQPLLAFGQEVPEEVSKRLRLSSHAFQLQSDGNFMLCETDGQVAKMLSGTVGLAQIDAAFTEIRKRKTDNDTALRCAETDEKRERDALERYSGCDAAEEAVRLLESAEEAVAAFEESIGTAEGIIGIFRITPATVGPALDRAGILLVAVLDAEKRVSDLADSTEWATSLVKDMLSVPASATRQTRSAKAALIGAEAAEKAYSDLNADVGSMSAFLSLVKAAPKALERSLAYAAGDAVDALSAANVKAEEAEASATAVRQLYGEIILAWQVASASRKVLAEVVGELNSYIANTPECPECGASREHWTIQTAGKVC